MRTFRYPILLFLSLFFLCCARAGTHSLLIRYQPAKEFSSLQQKIGPVLAIAPFRDERADRLYIGHHLPYRGATSYFKSDPFPLEKAITDSLTSALTRNGIKIVPLSAWDGRPESLKTMESDSTLMIEIKKFWIEGRAEAFRTHVKAGIHFVIHLGVKKEGKVFTRNIEVEKDLTLARSTPEKVKEMVNQILADIFDAFFSNPY